MKKGIFLVVALAAVLLMGTRAFAIEIFFEHREVQEVSRGVLYERNRMMTGRGMLDVHVLTVDLDEPYVGIAPVASAYEVGLRQTTSRMLSDAGAVAGINADFFNMARLHSIYFGPMVRDGQILSLSPNHYMATFLLDKQNNPFFTHMQTFMRLYADGHRVTNVAGYNSIGAEINAPKVVSRAAMLDTAAIDARIFYTTKFIVENDIVTRISRPGETVATPENGFVIIVPDASRYHYANFFRVGRRVNFNISTDLNLDFSAISSAIGGGDIILDRGRLVEYGGIQPNHRHPRTAVGATVDGRIILMVVDGRTHSIGVTHAELGAILQRYGAISAMHMDGGGSSTMVTRSVAGNFSVANTLSDGAQRRVTNALGVFNNAPIGEKIGIILETEQNRAVAGISIGANVLGTDTNGNRIPIDWEEEYLPLPVFSASPADGFWTYGRYTPLRTGLHVLNVQLGNLQASAEIYVYSLAELQPRNEMVNLLEGGRARLQFSGLTTDGSQVAIPEVTGLTVYPPYLGTFENGYFIAQRGGTGYISAAVGAVRAYIPVSIGGFPWPIDMFSSYLGFLSTPPQYVFTNVGTGWTLGFEKIQLDYRFSVTGQTQASYVTFYPALEIPGEPIALRMLVGGNDSGHWLRGRVRDYEGNFHNIDFARNLDFTGWEWVTANLPNAPAPFVIDRIYVVELESLEFSSNTIQFAQLEALYAPNHNLPVPQGTIFQDRLRAAPGFGGIPGGGFLEFPIPNPEGETRHSVAPVSNFAVATLTAQNGGIQATNIDQWRYLMPAIRAINSQNVLILLDENPLDFTRRMEFELFHLAMTQLRDEGRNIFVVSATVPYGNETILTMRDNIRYINVAQRENAASYIRFWTGANQVFWTD